AQYRGAPGKRANCQVAPSVHLVTDAASCPANRRLWDPSSPRVPDTEAVTARRRRVRISEEVAHVPKWRPAVDMLDEPLVVADEGYGQDGAFWLALTERNIAYVVGVRSDTALLAAGVCRTRTPYRGTGRRAAPRASKQRESRGIS
ncbi:transposase, partial [Streptosporangium sp. NPDC005286]|uniref:transposase n=1 Tax=Streptosporangium sp. NPDC005286 TaxID=3154463 RepID=UPI0033A67F93